MEWFRVLRDLTGTNLFFNFLFATIFFIPLIAKVFVFYSISSVASYPGVDMLANFCISEENCYETFVGAVALGQDPFLIFITVLILIYNIWRTVATKWAGQLLDEQQRSFYTPALRKYKWLSISRSWFSALWLLGAVAAFVHLVTWLSQPITLPL